MGETEGAIEVQHEEFEREGERVDLKERQPGRQGNRRDRDSLCLCPFEASF